MQISILGSGSWGLAIAQHLAKKGNRIRCFVRSSEAENTINNYHNSSKLLNVELDQNIIATTNLERCLEGTQLIICALPSDQTLSFVSQYKQVLSEHIPTAIVLSLTKGFDQLTLESQSEIFLKTFPKVDYTCLCGPNFALQVAYGQKSVTTIASSNPESLTKISDILSTQNFIVQTTQDVYGLEIIGLCKNPIAICMGLSDSLPLPHNTKSYLLQSLINEVIMILDYSAKLHQNVSRETFLLSCGFADIFLTATNGTSRNYAFGYNFFQNQTNVTYKTLEGLNSLNVIKRIATKNSLPLTHFQKLYEIINNNKDINVLL